jgi:hypothetical protein
LEYKRARERFLNEKKVKKTKRRTDLLVFRSFTEENMKYEETLLSTKNVQEMLDKTNIVADDALEKMKEAGKFPINESLLARPKDFKLRIDSFMVGCYDEE